MGHDSDSILSAKTLPRSKRGVSDGFYTMAVLDINQQEEPRESSIPSSVPEFVVGVGLGSIIPLSEPLHPDHDQADIRR